jgi:hypothetical protein
MGTPEHNPARSIESLESTSEIDTFATELRGARENSDRIRILQPLIDNLDEPLRAVYRRVDNPQQDQSSDSFDSSPWIPR